MWRERLQVKKDNAIAGLYPFAKLWMLGLYCCIVIIVSTAGIDGYPVYAMAALPIPIALAAASGIFPEFLKAFRALCVLVGVIIAAQAVLFPGPEVLWSVDVPGLFTLGVYGGGLKKGLTLGFYILDVGSIFIWFFRCTENRELVCACEKKGMSPKAGYVLLSTLQMVPVLQQSSKSIMSAQEARGVETRGGLRVRMRAFLPTLIPLVLGAINSTEERVLTLESRGFTARCPKTRLFDVEPNGKETLAVTLAAASAIAALVWRVLLWAL